MEDIGEDMGDANTNLDGDGGGNALVCVLDAEYGVDKDGDEGFILLFTPTSNFEFEVEKGIIDRITDPDGDVDGGNVF
jgi:hypothetical protein